MDLSSLFLAGLIPAVLFGFAAGAVVDRLGPARGFVAGSALRCLAVGIGLIFIGSPASAWAVAFAYSAVSQLSSPAEMALVRTLRPTGCAKAHSLIVALQYGGQAVGMLVLAPALYWLGGTQAIMAAAAVGFLGLTALTAVLALRLRTTPAAQMQPAREAFSFRETTRFFRRQPLARDAITVLAAKSVVAQGIVVALPLYLRHDIGLGHAALAFLLLPGIAGAAIGLMWAGPAVNRRSAGSTMRLALLAMAVSVFALAALDFGVTAVAEHSQIGLISHLGAVMNTTYVVAFPVAFLLGLALSGALVSARVALTETAPLGQQARVFAVQATLTDGIVVLPLLLMGVGAQLAGARPTLAAIGVLCTLALISIEHPRFKARPVLHGPALLEAAYVPALLPEAPPLMGGE
jgi:MFS family permease